MESVGDIWGLAAAKWDEVMSQVGDDDLAKSTTCADWSVQDLVDHAMHWQGQGAAVFGAGVDPDADWATLRPALASALADPTNLEGTVEAFGNMPKQAVAGLIITDLLIHSWDLAQSLGVNAALPAAAVDSAMAGLQRMPEEMLRGETMFGPATAVADDASAQDKLIAFVGRTP